MAVSYKLYQNKSEKSLYKGKWYARAVVNGVVNLNQMADIIQRNCTAKKSDVLAVLTELVEVMQNELQAGHRVKIDGFGSFKIGIASTPADSAAKWTVAQNVRGLRLNFQPEVHVSADKKRIKTFLTGIKLQELTDYKEPDKKPAVNP